MLFPGAGYCEKFLKNFVDESNDNDKESIKYMAQLVSRQHWKGRLVRAATWMGLQIAQRVRGILQKSIRWLRV